MKVTCPACTTNLGTAPDLDGALDLMTEHGNTCLPSVRAARNFRNNVNARHAARTRTDVRTHNPSEPSTRAATEETP